MSYIYIPPISGGNSVTKKYVDENIYYTYPTIRYDNASFPDGYVDIETLQPATTYKLPKGALSSSLKRVVIRGRNDNGTWTTIDEGSNAIGWGGYLDTTVTVMTKSSSQIILCVTHVTTCLGKMLSITKVNGKWTVSKIVLSALTTGNTMEFTPTSDYHPATKKYVDDVVAGVSGGSDFSGDYNDLINKPTIPTVTNDLTNTLKSNYDKAYTHSQSSHFNGDYNSLTNKPTIPSLNGYATEEYVKNEISDIELTPGKDGVSCTHSWNGTTLTVTSASGTTSADLKGEQGLKGDKGDQGEKGEKGDKGADGLTTSVKVNDTTYTHSDGLITLPNYPSLTGYATEEFVDSSIANAISFDADGNLVITINGVSKKFAPIE